MKPYFQDDSVTIYHGDCREILPELKKADLVLTDPPYGIGMDGGNVGYKGFNNFEKMDWDKKPPSKETLELVLKAGKNSVLWGGNYFQLPPSRCWLIWDKGAGFKGRTYAEAELAWTSLDANVKIFSFDPLAKGTYRGKHHPTMKPLSLMNFCLNLFPDAATVIDPFMGSGTTLRAAKNLGKISIGIEAEEKYCQVAAERMAQQVLDL